MKETLLCLTQDEIEKRLVEAGIQPTAQRIAICRYVLCEADHPTADDVKSWADKNFPKMSLATVYNTLNILVEGKLLKEFKFPHTEKVIYDNNVAKHFHFYDEKTGEVSDIMPDQIEINFKGKKFKVSEVELIIKGTKVK
jgi:Fur family iron response transcriptional regulator